MDNITVELLSRICKDDNIRSSIRKYDRSTFVALQTIGNVLNSNIESSKMYKLNNMKDKINKVMDAYTVILNNQDLIALNMDMIRTKYPYLIEQFKDNPKILETLFGSCKTPEYVTEFLSIYSIPKPKNFVLKELEQSWEPYSAIGMYNEGKLTIDDMKQWFYYNAGLSTIQTINVVQGTRVIETITWIFPLIEELDVYASAYMEDRKPNYIPKNLDILIVPNMGGSLMDKLVTYISNNGITTIPEIKAYYYTISSVYPIMHITSVIDQLNTICLDITYSNKNAYSIVEIPIGTILRCSMKTGASYNTVYYPFNGNIDGSIRVPKNLRHYTY